MSQTLGKDVTDMVGSHTCCWDQVLLDSVAKRGSGHTPDKKHPEYWGGTIKWISLQDSASLDSLYIDETAATITIEGINNSSAVLHSKGTVVLSRDAGVGKSAIMTDDMAVSQHFMAWTCSTRLDNHFLYYWLQSKKSEFERIANGNTIKTIGLPYFKELVIPLPQADEQKRIASALTDIDALITHLDQLIAKKRDIQQAAMQQLLTGQRRLPGFSGEWEVKRLGDCLLAKPDYGINAPAVAYSDALPTYIRITDINDDGYFSPLPRASVDSPLSSEYLLEDGDVVFARTGASVGKSYRYRPEDGPLVFAGFLIRARPNQEKLVSPFLAAYVKTQSYWNWVRLMSMRSGQPGINGHEYASLPIRLPSVEEQTAIATLLSDMDTELTALQTRRDKARQIKQGMMQELLTGRVRLI